MGEPQPSDKIPVLIVGAGPAGLAAAHRCLAEGVGFCIIEAGEPLQTRQSQDTDDLASGVGGSGLYSDGKLSFYPSAHSLWALPGTRLLREAYGWLQNLVIDLVGPFPPVPMQSNDIDMHDGNPVNQEFGRKDYKSLVLNLDARRKLLERLLGPIQHHVHTGTRVTNVDRTSNGFHVTLLKNDGSTFVVNASYVILCLGRFCSMMLPKLFQEIDTVFRRFEFGVRIEQKVSAFFLRDDPSTDTKLLLKSPADHLEWRTFCCCRDGSVLRTRLGPLQTFSGTSCTNSGFSNIGFNCRILSPSLFASVQSEADRALTGKVAPFSVSINQFCQPDGTSVYYGPNLDDYLRRGLSTLRESFDLNDAVLHGPCVEGIGLYPRLTSRLETSMRGVFMAGDGCGIFRGLLPAFISGTYAAACAALDLKTNVTDMSTNAHIKMSDSGEMPSVFTAQSKKFFYCRDAICEYVLARGRLPVNPFRVFDYFLGDRVDRDLIRRGNNQLVRSCDELWAFGPVADGVLFELFYAAHIGKPIRFFTIDTRASAIRQIEVFEDIVFEPEVHAPQQTRQRLIEELERMLNVRTIHRQPTLFDLL